MLTDSAIWKSLSSSKRLVVIAGPCVIEDEELCLTVARSMQSLCEQIDATYVFKASFDKANRTSAGSFRGPGVEEGLEILGNVRNTVQVPVLTDIHTQEQAAAAGAVVDVIQIPAFLCRQTDLIAAAARTGKVVNLKKGQFLSPLEMAYAVEKARASGSQKIMLTERGTTFGYNNLVVDMRAIPVMRRLGCPVIFDATHSVQLPGGAGGRSGGQREFAPVLARSALAAGASGLFMETHPEPEEALSDGPNSIPLGSMAALLKNFSRLWKVMREIGE